MIYLEMEDFSVSDKENCLIKNNNWGFLILKVPVTTAEDSIFKYFFIVFKKRIRHIKTYSTVKFANSIDIQLRWLKIS